MVVGHAVEEIAVVGDEEQRAGVAHEPFLEPQHGVEVEMIGRLVEQQQIRAAHQRLREVEAHPPSAGKASDGLAVPPLGEAQPRQQRRGARAGGVAADLVEAVMQLGEGLTGELRADRRSGLRRQQRALDFAQFPVAVEHEFDGRRGGGRRFLRDVRDGPRRRQRNVARVLVQLAANQREHARLAAAVRPDQADLVPVVDGEVRAVEQALGAAGEDEVGQAKHVRVRSGQRFRGTGAVPAGPAGARYCSS